MFADTSTEESWVVPFATDANILDVGNVTDPYGWLICAGGEPLSGVSTTFSSTAGHQSSALC